MTLKKFESYSLSFVLLCLIVIFFTKDGWQAVSVSSAVILFLFAFIIFPFKRKRVIAKNPKAVGKVMEISDSISNGKIIITIKFEYDDIPHFIYITKNSENLLPIGSEVFISVNEEEIGKSYLV